MANKHKFYISMTDREIGLGWLYLLLELFIIPILLDMLRDALPDRPSAAVMNFIFYGLNFSAVIVIFHGFLRKNLAAAGRKFWDFVQAVILGFVAYYFASMLLGILFQLIYPGFANVNDRNLAGQAISHFRLTVIGTVLLVPVAEETLFRGLIFHWLLSRRRTAAYILSTLVFCAVHVAGYLGRFDPLLLVLCFLQYIPAGLALAWSYEKCGSIFAPILIHTAVNAIGIYAMR